MFLVGSLTAKLPSTMTSKSSGVSLSLERHISAIDSQFLMSALKTYVHHPLSATISRDDTHVFKDRLSSIVDRL